MISIKTKYYIKKFVYYIFHPILFFRSRKMIQLIKNESLYNDETFIKKCFKTKIGKELDLANPKTFNEKMQWLKLYDRNPLYTLMVDKHAVKEYVSNLIGSQYIAKEYGCFERFEDIDFSKLPNEFVLKTTHTSGCVLVCKDKNSLDLKTISDKFNKSILDNYYLHCREWPYKNVPHRIIAEKYLSDEDFDVLPVYKFFCFNGEPYLLQAIKNDKQPNEEIDYFDMNWNKLKIKQNYPNCKKSFPKPKCFQEMINLSRKLSQNIPFVRCDYFSINDKVYFSEFTFFSDAGFEPFHPKKWDAILGDKIVLPIERKFL